MGECVLRSGIQCHKKMHQYGQSGVGLGAEVSPYPEEDSLLVPVELVVWFNTSFLSQPLVPVELVVWFNTSFLSQPLVPVELVVWFNTSFLSHSLWCLWSWWFGSTPLSYPTAFGACGAGGLVQHLFLIPQPLVPVELVVWFNTSFLSHSLWCLWSWWFGSTPLSYPTAFGACGAGGLVQHLFLIPQPLVPVELVVWFNTSFLSHSLWCLWSWWFGSTPLSYPSLWCLWSWWFGSTPLSYPTAFGACGAGGLVQHLFLIPQSLVPVELVVWFNTSFLSHSLWCLWSWWFGSTPLSYHSLWCLWSWWFGSTLSYPSLWCLWSWWFGSTPLSYPSLWCLWSWWFGSTLSYHSLWCLWSWWFGSTLSYPSLWCLWSWWFGSTPLSYPSLWCLWSWWFGSTPLSYPSLWCLWSWWFGSTPLSYPTAFGAKKLERSDSRENCFARNRNVKGLKYVYARVLTHNYL